MGYYAPDDPEPARKGPLAQEDGSPWLAGPSTDIWWYGIRQHVLRWPAKSAIGGFSYTDVTKSRSMTKRPAEDAQRGDIVLFTGIRRSHGSGHRREAKSRQRPAPD